MAAIDHLDLLTIFRKGRARPVLQSEPAECGLACLATVAAYHGFETDMASLRARFPISLKGTTLATIIRIADAMGLSSRPLRLEPEALELLALPAILHWNFEHFVVLTKISGSPGARRFVVADPTVGERKLSAAELSQCFTGVALELEPGPDFRTGSEKVKLRLYHLWSQTRGLGGAIAQILTLTILMHAVVIVTPFFTQYAIDTILPSHQPGLLAALAVGFLIVALTGIAASMLRGYLLTNLGQLLGYQLVVNVARHLFRLPLSWFEKRQVGDLLSRLESTLPLSEFLSRTLFASLVDGVMALLTLAMMFFYSPSLSFVALGAVGVYAAVRLGLLPAYNRRLDEALVSRGRENGVMIENLEGIAGIKAFGQESERLAMWIGRKAEAVNRGTSTARIQTLWEILDPSVRALENVLFIVIGIAMVMNGSLTLGMLFAFAAYKLAFLTAAINLVQLGGTYRMLDVHLNRIADVALTAPEPLRDFEMVDRRPFEGSVELQGVTFSYGTGEAPVLRDVSLAVSSGESVAIVGRSGGGKTTLLKVMLGLLEPASGKVLIDGSPLNDFGPRAWRRQVGYVAQSDVLFSGSIAQNIAFFEAALDVDRVEAAARAAVIHDDIMKMPMGYDTLVGDMGSTLSGGQKARILFARALYRNPKLLIIDEGSAHLDVDTEQKVNESIKKLGITRIIVSHRPETIALADRTIHLVDGRVQPNGSS